MIFLNPPILNLEDIPDLTDHTDDVTNNFLRHGYLATNYNSTP